jgi:programmed cell death protein 5
MMEEDRELEEIKRRKLQELMRQQAAAEDEERRRAQEEAQRQAILRQILTPEARERLARVKMAHPQLAVAIENQLIYLAQMGRLAGRKITDEELKAILARMSSRKREIRIERR